ncbi:Hydroxysteroid dehydrogenase-like protein 2 [Desmophyllum pertusum]|uniref:Hydroxysteroid dehydrogenase-like protein 2 n=1 Tax=Desmophyllum pertusum TaxID=174260 RepID=A0A9W9YIY2_9CNID|nr:Hydroxysteroid dehydrogenase-like protein 2 [Desmophyllum pertusum]
MPDFFLDVEDSIIADEIIKANKTMESDSQASPGGGVVALFDTIKSFCNEELVDSVKGVFEFQLEGKEPGVWYLDLKNNAGSAGSGSFPGGDAGCTMILDSDDFIKLFTGQLNPTQAFMAGKLKIKGDMMMAMKLEKLMGQMKSKL